LLGLKIHLFYLHMAFFSLSLSVQANSVSAWVLTIFFNFSWNSWGSKPLDPQILPR
jgi:hypothetical protein